MAECSLVLDVGGTYSPSTLRFDHHQKGFSEIFGDGGFEEKSNAMEVVAGGESGDEEEKVWFETKLSSAGLLYK